MTDAKREARRSMPKERLERLYLKDGLSILQLAERTQSTRQSVSKLLKRFRIELRPRAIPRTRGGEMLYLVIKAGLSGVIIAIVSEVARKNPGLGALIASLPLVSILGMIWLWRDTSDPVRLVDHAQATFWFVLPSLPMFLLVPLMLRRGLGFWPALAAGCILTILLYVATTWALDRAGVRL